MAAAHDSPPRFVPLPGWKPAEFPRSFGTGRSFVSGETAGDRLIVHYYEEADPAVLHALAWFGPGAEGPPGHAHGGGMAAVLDEAMGFSAWHAGHPVVAATITVNFRRKLPLGVVRGVTCRVERVDDRKVYTRGQIYDLHGGAVFTDAEGLFIIQPLDAFGGPDGPLPGRK